MLLLFGRRVVIVESGRRLEEWSAPTSRSWTFELTLFLISTDYVEALFGRESITFAEGIELFRRAIVQRS